MTLAQGVIAYVATGVLCGAIAAFGFRSSNNRGTLTNLDRAAAPVFVLLMTLLWPVLVSVILLDRLMFGDRR